MNFSVWLCTVIITFVLCACGGSTSNSNVAIDTRDIIVHIDPTVETPAYMSIGEQLDDHAAYDQINGQFWLNALSARWFRIHAGADNAVLPEPGSIAGVAAWDFSALDRLVDIAYQAGTKPILNIRTAPVSLSTCSQFHSEAGSLNDPSFNDFANYAAALVAYFNLGSYTDAHGVVHRNPAGTSHRIDYWELWNEPDLSYEFPCLRGVNQPSLSVSEFAIMWDVTTHRMRAVDPDLKFVGPAVSDPRNLNYLNRIIAQGQMPDVISMHGYAGSNAAQDSDLVQGGSGAIGVVGIHSAVHSIIEYLDAMGLTLVPLFLDEYNVSPDDSDDTYGRGWNNFGVALGGSMFIRLAHLSATHPISFIPFQFVEASGLRLTSLNSVTGAPMLPYWRDKMLSRALQVGDVTLAVQSSSNKVDVLAVRRADGSGIGVLIANVNVIASGAGTKGQDITVNLNVGDAGTGIPSSVSITMIDGTTNSTSEPSVMTLDPREAPVVQFHGYGIALVEVMY